MKKGGIVLLFLTLFFCAFTIGLLVGRHTTGGNVTIIVPTTTLSEDLPEEPSNPVQSGTPQGLKVNINTADVELLDALPGVGPVLAQRIIAYRTENGPFKDIQSLLLVEGIGEKKLEQILNLITLED